MTSLKCDDIVSGITHDLKSPLNALIGFVELALEDLTNISEAPIETIKDLNMVRNIGKDMTSLINNMLTSARIQSGQQPLSLAVTQ